MARAENTELIDRFEEFYRNYYRNEIGELAQQYPSEQKSLFIDWNDLYRFDPDLADDYQSQPEQLGEYAEEALRLYDLPVDVKLGQAHVRMTNLPDATDIRDIRADHRGQLISVRGIVRKATEVRPKITDAAFECQRCGTLTRIPQADGNFQEPHECQGCERQGPFRINFDQSEFVDAQKLRVQESPEGLRGGETPQAIDINIEDDITGEVTAGDHVRVTGVLKLDQRTDGNEKSPMFDTYMQGRTVEIEDEQFEEMDITDADKKEIVALSEEPDIYEQMVDSIAPSIYGYRQEKLAMILQLFSGVSKDLPDGSRIRGDLHMLLIGDPGTGKCLRGDTKVTLSDGRTVSIRKLVESNLDDPRPVDDGVWDTVDVTVPSMQDDGSIEPQRATKVWKREAPDEMYRIRTGSGREVDVTPSHPLFIQSDGSFQPTRATKLSEGSYIAIPRDIRTESNDDLSVDFRIAKSHNRIDLQLPEQWTPDLARLIGYIVAEGYVEQRDDNTGFVSITNNDDEVLEDAIGAIETLNLDVTERSSHEDKEARELICSAGEFVSFLASLEESLLSPSGQRRVPSELMGASNTIVTAFLKGYVEGEGHVSASEREISVASMSRELLEDVRSMLLSLGITPQIHARNNGSYRLRISGDAFDRYVSIVGFVTDRKHNACNNFEGPTGSTNVDVVPNVGSELRRIREPLELTQAECGLPRSTYQRYERGTRHPSRESLRTVVETFQERLENISEEETGDATAATDGGGLETLRRDTESLRSLVGGHIAWDKIESIETVEPEDEWVYDLEVDGTHNYISNGIVSHNSQMLSYIQNIAPRSVYTSGKGSSAAGLCVVGDTMVHTSDGFTEIRDIVSGELPDPVNEETSAQKAIDIQTFDREAGEMTDAVSSHVWRMPEKPCRRIETNHGKELEASVGTPVLTCGEDGMEWTEISNVAAGDHVAVPRYDRIDRTERSVREFLELTTEKIRLSDESIDFLRNALREEFGTLRDAAAELDLSEDFIYLHLKNRHVPIEKLDRMLDAVGASRDSVTFDRLMLSHGDSITVPEAFDEDLMYLLGLVFGDGDISLDRRGGNRGFVRISNSDETFLERAQDIFEAKFDKRPEIEYRDDGVPCIRFNGATIARLFENAGMQSPKVDLTLAPELTTAEHADAFLRGLMDADGAVSVRDSGGSSIVFSSISETLARQVQHMLETYNVRAKIRERDRRGTYERADGYEIESRRVQYYVEMYGADIARFADQIGFGCVEKQAALEQITADERKQREMLPIGSTLATVEGPAGAYHNNVRRGDDAGRERTASMLDDIDLGSAEPLVREVVDANLEWDEVVAAVDTGEKEVFDLTVPETHNFVGNGLVTHNTAAAVRDDFGDGQQWSLEAGALVLADQGIAAVDELDKMRCVAGETLVDSEDGIVRIRDLAHDAAAEGTIEPLPNGRTIRDVNLRVWTMTDDGRLVTRPVTAIHEYDAPDRLKEVRLETGERLTTTEDHPFFVWTGDGRVKRPAADLTEDDWVYVPRSLESPASDGGAVAASGNESGDRSAAEGVSPALAAILGYLAGDGNLYHERAEGVYGIRFINSEEELLADFERVCRTAFDADPTRPPSEQREDGVETVRVPGKDVADTVIEAGMNHETYGGKRLPEAVTRSSRAAKAAFVRALSDSEGTVGERLVRITSASYELLLASKQLLLEFGITSQIQTCTRSDHRDIYRLAITDAESLAAFDRHIGFTLDRKQTALSRAVETVSGDRTVLDVIPHCGPILSDCRESLRLYQSECGLDGVTYCNFENGDANISIRAARVVLERFETRKHTATNDLDRVTGADWGTLETLRQRYHVSQADIAVDSEYTQQRISDHWDRDTELQRAVQQHLERVIEAVATANLSPFRSLVHGDIKWRRVTEVEDVEPAVEDDRLTLCRDELAELLGCAPEAAIERAESLLASTPRIDGKESIQDVTSQYEVSYATLADDLDVAPSTVSRWVRSVVETDRFDALRDAVRRRIHEIRDEARALLDEIEARRQPSVYDLTVEGTHNFVANGMIVHNSEDRSAMHEALEQQSISVSKAGINATLKSRCSLLGAANPKYGRFDQYESIGEQIDLEPALISRFDLIFTVTDEPDEEKDRKLARHIVKTNYAGELHTHRQENATPDFSAEEVETVTEEVDPEVEPELLRRYIAYAKRNCFPTMTEEAKDRIEEFYVDLRSKGQDEDAPVPVTARKIEALIRLAEASARVRLADTVEARDADQVIEIVRSCLQDIGVDPETGELDADVVETGTSKSQRDRIQNIRALIADIEDEYDEGAPKDVVIERAEEIGISESKAEKEIEKLKQQGELYEPSHGNVRTT